MEWASGRSLGKPRRGEDRGRTGWRDGRGGAAEKGRAHWGGGVKRPSKAGNPTGALELASGRCPRAERSRFQITAEENENKSSPERCFFKSARGC